jgi:hypothetical protein
MNLHGNAGESCRADSCPRTRKTPACHRQNRAGAAAGVRSNAFMLRLSDPPRIGRPAAGSRLSGLECALRPASVRAVRNNPQVAEFPQAADLRSPVLPARSGRRPVPFRAQAWTPFCRSGPWRCTSVDRDGCAAGSELFVAREALLSAVRASCGGTLPPGPGQTPPPAREVHHRGRAVASVPAARAQLRLTGVRTAWSRPTGG